MAGLRLTEPAERDIAGLLDWTAVTFGPAARRRYEALVAASAILLMMGSVLDR
jgi:plasmid stabilization system protein ParE